MTLAQRLYDLRMRRNMSLQEVADAIGRSKAHVWNLENGASDSPSIKLVIGLAEAFRVSVAHLVGESPDSATDDSEAVAILRNLKRLDARDRAVVWTLLDRHGRSPIDDGRPRPRPGRSKRAHAGRDLHSLEPKV